MIQLALNPEIVWGILGPCGALEEEDDTEEPILFGDELSAHRFRRCLRFQGRVVRVECHPAVEGANGLPTYVVL